MMNRPDGPRTVAFALCGSFCSFSAVLPQVRRLRASEVRAAEYRLPDFLWSEP